MTLASSSCAPSPTKDLGEIRTPHPPPHEDDDDDDDDDDEDRSEVTTTDRHHHGARGQGRGRKGGGVGGPGVGGENRGLYPHSNAGTYLGMELDPMGRDEEGDEDVFRAISR